MSNCPRSEHRSPLHLCGAEGSIKLVERLRLILAEHEMLTRGGLNQELKVADTHERVAVAAQFSGSISNRGDVAACRRVVCLRSEIVRDLASEKSCRLCVDLE